MKEKSWQHVCIVLGAMSCLTILELAAIMTGHNGTILKIIIAIIAMLAGLVIDTSTLFSRSETK